MIIVDCEQGNEQWLALKAGVPSASNFDKIITTKGDKSKQAEKYMYQLAGEKITGIREDSFQSQAMQRGIEMEQEAADFYALVNNCNLLKVAVCYKNEDKKILCSPDRLVDGKPILVEIKCPLIHTHVGYMLKPESLKQDYFQQIQCQLYITEYEYCDIISYYPGLHPVVLRVEKDKEFIEKLDVVVKEFCDDLEEVIKKIK